MRKVLQKLHFSKVLVFIANYLAVKLCLHKKLYHPWTWLVNLANQQQQVYIPENHWCTHRTQQRRQQDTYQEWSPLINTIPGLICILFGVERTHSNATWWPIKKKCWNFNQTNCEYGWAKLRALALTPLKVVSKLFFLTSKTGNTITWVHKIVIEPIKNQINLSVKEQRLIFQRELWNIRMTKGSWSCWLGLCSSHWLNKKLIKK